jgi:hypothetical protein
MLAVSSFEPSVPQGAGCVRILNWNELSCYQCVVSKWSAFAVSCLVSRTRPLMLVYRHAHCPFPNLGEMPICFAHSPILSGVGVFGKRGAIHRFHDAFLRWCMDVRVTPDKFSRDIDLYVQVAFQV